MTEENDVVEHHGAHGAASIGRRNAIKKGVTGAVVAGAVWNAPRVEGLSLRPNYAAAASGSPAVFRSNAGGPTIPAIDGGPDWVGDNYLVAAGTGQTIGFPAVAAGPTVPATVPEAIFDTERYSGAGLGYSVPAPAGAPSTVRLFFGNGFDGTSMVGDRFFDILIDGVTVATNFDPIASFGHLVGGMLEFSVVSDGSIDITFVNVVENVFLSGIEVFCP